MTTTNRENFVQIFDLIDRLPGVFRKQPFGSRFSAMDDDNTYVIESLGECLFGLPPRGFSLRIVCRNSARYEEHHFQNGADSDGLSLFQGLKRFRSNLHEQIPYERAELPLHELKRAFNEARGSLEVIKEEACNGPSGVARQTLEYVLSRAELTGDVLISLDDPLRLESFDREVIVEGPLPPPLDTLKPTIGLYICDGELRQLTTASFWLGVPARNVIDHMKAAGKLIESGVSEETMDRLEDLIELLSKS